MVRCVLMGTMESTARDTSAPAPSSPAQALINWDLAASTAARLTSAGPVLSPAEIGDAVDSLRRLADESVHHVHQITGLEAARDLRDSSVLVVDRASWAKANTQSFAVMLKPAMEKMLESRRGTVSPAAAAVSGAITGSQRAPSWPSSPARSWASTTPSPPSPKAPRRRPAAGCCWWPPTS